MIARPLRMGRQSASAAAELIEAKAPSSLQKPEVLKLKYYAKIFRKSGTLAGEDSWSGRSQDASRGAQPKPGTDLRFLTNQTSPRIFPSSYQHTARFSAAMSQPQSERRILPKPKPTAVSQDPLQFLQSPHQGRSPEDLPWHDRKLAPVQFAVVRSPFSAIK